MTPYQLHVLNWKNCTRCELSKTRRSVVLTRGTVPCDVLFVGEAPGASEDVLGRPFVGPAGKLLDSIVRESLAEWQGPEAEGPERNSVTVAFTNLVCCLPVENYEKGQPQPGHVAACRPRLEEMIRVASPRLIVRVGTLSKDCLEPGFKHSVSVPAGILMVDVVHPAFILRSNPAARSLLVKRCVVTIRNAVRGVLGC